MVLALDLAFALSAAWSRWASPPRVRRCLLFHYEPWKWLCRSAVAERISANAIRFTVAISPSPRFTTVSQILESGLARLQILEFSSSVARNGLDDELLASLSYLHVLSLALVWENLEHWMPARYGCWEIVIHTFHPWAARWGKVDVWEADAVFFQQELRVVDSVLIHSRLPCNTCEKTVFLDSATCSNLRWHVLTNVFPQPWCPPWDCCWSSLLESSCWGPVKSTAHATRRLACVPLLPSKRMWSMVLISLSHHGMTYSQMFERKSAIT